MIYTVYIKELSIYTLAIVIFFEIGSHYVAQADC
jgi:hypothetical protein